MNFYSGKQAHSNFFGQEAILRQIYEPDLPNRHEIKVGAHGLLGISLFQAATIQMSYNTLNLAYM